MNKKIILSISLIVLIGLVVFVSASMTLKSNGTYDVETSISKGWNLIAATIPEQGILEDSEIQLEDIKAAWFYTTKFGELSPTGEYVRAYPNFDEKRFNQADDTEMIRNAMWVYSDKSGILKYNTLENYKELDSRNLWRGWNFVTITPDMVGKSLNEIKGSCNVEKVYGWNNQEISGGGNWDSISLTYKFGENVVSKGILIKVSSNCNLGTSTDGTNPPGLPSGDECIDSDNGKNYYIKGTTKGIDPNGVAFDFVDGCEASNTEVHEYYCKEPNPQGTYFEQLNNDWINYKCPNGCQDGACIE